VIWPETRGAKGGSPGKKKDTEAGSKSEKTIDRPKKKNAARQEVLKVREILILERQTDRGALGSTGIQNEKREETNHRVIREVLHSRRNRHRRGKIESS